MKTFFKNILTLIILFLLLFLTGCTDLKKPETNLEFWIGEDVNDTDFSLFTQKYGMFGGDEYYGSGYIPVIDENKEQRDPDIFVLYTVTSFPDYSSGHLHVTSITITDPKIYFYDLSLTSTKEEISSKMESLGFTIEKMNNTLIARKGKYTFSFSENEIYIRVEVTNKQGIIF